MLREPGIALEAKLGCRTAAEIDGGPRQGIVHRDDCVAVARDSATVAERTVERLPEGERRILGRVVLTGLQVTDAVEHEVETCVERELLEQVVVEPRAGLDDDAAGAVETEADAHPGLSGRAEMSDATAGGFRDGRWSVEHPCERSKQQVVVLAVPHAEADPVRVDAHHDPGAQQRAGDRLRIVERHEEEVRRRRERRKTERPQRTGADAGARRPASGRPAGRSARGAPVRPRRPRSAAAPGGGSARPRCPRPRAAYPTRAPASAKDFENVRMTTTPSPRSPTAVSPEYS